MSNSYRRAFAIIGRLATLSRFSSVGLIATLVYLAVSNGVIGTGWTTPAWASLLGYLAGMVVSFLGQSQFTFRTGRVTTRQVVRFCLTSAMGIIISWGGIHFLVTYVSLRTVPATIAVAALIAFFSFVIMNVWVFRPAV